MAIDDNELRRTVMGLLTLANREAHDGTLFQTSEGAEAIRTLSAELNNYDFDVRLSASSSEQLGAQVRELVRGVLSDVGGDLLRALMIMTVQFGGFCALIREQEPDIDIEAILQGMALAAAEESES